MGHVTHISTVALHQLSNCSIMVKEKLIKPDKKILASTEVQEDIEMGDVVPEKVCYIQTLYNSHFNYWFSS